MEREIYIVNKEESGERIDALLARNIEELSRTAVQRLIDDAVLTVNGRAVKKNYRCADEDAIEYVLPEISEVPLLAQNIPLDVIYEDEDIIVINKERGMVVHPAPGHPDGTLVNALLYHCGESLKGIGGEKRPGIVHRIDKDTSGLLVVAKSEAAHTGLSSQLSDHSMHREYTAIACGKFKADSGTVNEPIGRHRTERKRMAVTAIGSKPAVTHWFVKKQYRDYALIGCRLETGRTHQIRVHMSYIGHPLLGDSLYGARAPDKGLSGQCLHAGILHLVHPISGEKMLFEAPLPDYFNEIILKLGNPIE